MLAKVIELEKIKIGAVSYLNTKPLLFGIKHSAALMNQIELVEDYPSKIAEMLLDGSIDMGLVPVSIIPQLKEYYIISDYCIGADGDVASVCLFSEVPIEKVEKILLDYQSRTSVLLCKILLKHFWKISPLIENATQNFEKNIKGTTAALIIGDRALEQRKNSTYIYDLAGVWKTYTGLPFVFAVWLSNKKLPENFVDLFNKANKEGLNQIKVVIEENKCEDYNLNTYFTHNIGYKLTEAKREGMNLFLKTIETL